MRRFFDLFGDILKVVVILKSWISECVGFFLDYEDVVDISDVWLVVVVFGDMWFDEGLLEIDRMLLEGVEIFFVCEISSYVCESFFISFENILDCE